MVRTFPALVTMFANGTAASGPKFQDLLDTVENAVGPTMGYYYAVVSPGASPSPAIVVEVNGMGGTAEFALGSTGMVTLSCTGAFSVDYLQVSITPTEAVGAYFDAGASTDDVLQLAFYDPTTGSPAWPSQNFSLSIRFLAV